MDWAVGCHLGRGKTIQRRFQDVFIGEIIQKVEMKIKKAQVRDKLYYDKKHLHNYFFMSYFRKHYILDR